MGFLCKQHGQQYHVDLFEALFKIPESDLVGFFLTIFYIVQFGKCFLVYHNSMCTRGHNYIETLFKVCVISLW